MDDARPDNSDNPSDGYANGYNPQTNGVDAAQLAADHGFKLGAPSGAVSRGAPRATPTLSTEESPAFPDDGLNDGEVFDTPDDYVPDIAPDVTEAAVHAAEESRDKELDLMEHLRELRTRMLWCVGALAVAICVAWSFTDRVQAWFIAPILATLKKHGVSSQLVTRDPTEGFTVYFQTALATSLLVVAPFILWQMWRFIEPALTNNERKYGLVLGPFSIALFATGATLGFAMSPVFFEFFLAFQPQGSIAQWSYATCVVLLAKMLLVFGICFQVPVVTIFVTKIGLVSRNILLEYWRHVVVGIFVIVAIITPTWDPITLTACALPPCLLYGLSLWMVKWL